MIELNTFKKNKINLQDYFFDRDLENRILCASFEPIDISVLEEIIYSPLRVSLKKMAKNLDLDEEEILVSLKKIQHTGLFSFEDDVIVVDKEIRKYFENHLSKYELNFQPGMDYLQSLLKKVPIDIIPSWYGITKSSNSIFDCLIEKFLLTPSIFNNYFKEIHFEDPLTQRILDDLYQSAELKLSLESLMSTYHLDRRALEKHLILLEFHFLACHSFQREEGKLKEYITPFHEWKEYLIFLRNSHPQTLAFESIVRKKDSEFPFIDDLTLLLNYVKKNPLALAHLKEKNHETTPLFTYLAGEMGFSHNNKEFQDYLLRLITKLSLVKLADVVEAKLYLLEPAHDWLKLNPLKKAHFLYRHPLNRCLSSDLPLYLWTEKNMRELEKSLSKIAYLDWITLEDFLKNLTIPIGDQEPIQLKKSGRLWKYMLPQYTSDEQLFIRTIIMEWFFESGLIEIGLYQDMPCFRVTSFGQSLFL